MSGATDELLAVLDAAEACLRAAIAEALPPAAVLRIERNSTREARRLVAEAAVDRTVDLPLGWAEFVEIDADLDALLARLPPVQVVERVVARPRPTPLPVEITVGAASPTHAEAPLDVYVEEVVPPPVATESWSTDLKSEPLPAIAPEPTWVVGLDTSAPPSTQPSPAADDDLPSWAAPAGDDDDDEATVVESPAAVDALRAVRADDEPSYVQYEQHQVYEDDDDELAYYDAPLEPADEVSYITYVEPTEGVAERKVADDEPLPAWAAVETPVEEEPVRSARPVAKRKEPEPKSAPAPAPVAEPESGDESWAFSGAAAPAAPTEPVGDAYAVLRKERMRLDDFTQVERPVPVDEDEATNPRAGRATRSGPAAVQISADGSARVIGDDEEDEASNVIPLGDTRDYGEEDGIDDDQTGILGVGVVEYDDEDELEEIEEIENGLEDLPGAPELTPAEISALYARAADVGKRNMSDGALLLGDVLDADPHRIDALLARGRFLLDLGDFPGSISDFLKAETLHPRDPDVQVALGDLFQGRKDYGKAVSYYNRALAIDADHAQALLRRGMAHLYRKQYAAAEQDLERAKKIEPGLPHVDTYLSRARKR